MAFGGWLILLTVQCWLIRSNRRDLHRKLGILGAVLAGVMLIVGPETALVMDRVHYAEDGKPHFWEDWKEISMRIVGV